MINKAIFDKQIRLNKNKSSDFSANDQLAEAFKKFQ